MKSIKDYILFFLAFTTTYSLITILLSSLRGEISYEVDLVETLFLGILMTGVMAWFRKRESKKGLEGGD